MRKLPEIYKAVVTVNNNKTIYYSKSEPSTTNLIEKKKVEITSSISDVIKSLFQYGKASYTKKVRIKTKDKVYETRLIRRNNGKLLTIDNDIINESDIISLEIL